MVLKFIDEELKSLGLDPIQLSALAPDDNAYSVLLNQHKGEATATADFIGNTPETQKTAIEKCVSFSKVALESSYDLAVSPEYSTPWKAISTIMDAQILPKKGQLWIFGAESIKPKELREFIESKTGVHWIYDKELVDQKNDKIFFDSVCYFFKATKSGKEVDVCTVQFKNQHMSVHSDIYREEDFLIEGRFLYVLRNSGSTVNLITMICSDSLKFKRQSLLDFDLDKLLIVHIQLNVFPRNDAFKAYRNTIFTHESDKIEVICLNWAKGSRIMNSSISFSGSAYYIKSEKPVLDDDRLNLNQDNGVFYCYWNEKRCHTFFFSSDEYLIGFKTNKASQALVEAAQLRRREGPVSSDIFVWDDGEYKKAKEIPDSFREHCAGLQCDLSPLETLGHVNKERLIKLSNGINLAKNWYDVRFFDFFSITDTEIVSRVTFNDEINVAAQTNRRNNLMHMKDLVHLFKIPSNVPPQLSVLTQNAKIHYNKTDPYFNIYSNDSVRPLGTISYLGSNVIGFVKGEFDNLVKLQLDSFAPDQKDRKKPSILLWYMDGAVLRTYYSDKPDIDTDFAEYGTAIDKDS